MWVIAVLLVLLTLLRGVYYSALTHLLANLSPEWQTSNIFSIIGGLIKVWHFPFTECNLYCHLRMLLECARIVSIAALYFRACILLSVKLTQILAELFVNSCHFYPLFTWPQIDYRLLISSTICWIFRKIEITKNNGHINHGSFLLFSVFIREQINLDVYVHFSPIIIQICS